MDPKDRQRNMESLERSILNKVDREQQDATGREVHSDGSQPSSSSARPPPGMPMDEFDVTDVGFRKLSQLINAKTFKFLSTDNQNVLKIRHEQATLARRQMMSSRSPGANAKAATGTSSEPVTAVRTSRRLRGDPPSPSGTITDPEGGVRPTDGRVDRLRSGDSESRGTQPGIDTSSHSGQKGASGTGQSRHTLSNDKREAQGVRHSGIDTPSTPREALMDSPAEINTPRKDQRREALELPGVNTPTNSNNSGEARRYANISDADSLMGEDGEVDVSVADQSFYDHNSFLANLPSDNHFHTEDPDRTLRGDHGGARSSRPSSRILDSVFSAEVPRATQSLYGSQERNNSAKQKAMTKNRKSLQQESTQKAHESSVTDKAIVKPPSPRKYNQQLANISGRNRNNTVIPAQTGRGFPQQVISISDWSSFSRDPLAKDRLQLLFKARNLDLSVTDDGYQDNSWQGKQAFLYCKFLEYVIKSEQAAATDLMNEVQGVQKENSGLSDRIRELMRTNSSLTDDLNDYACRIGDANEKSKADSVLLEDYRTTIKDLVYEVEALRTSNGKYKNEATQVRKQVEDLLREQAASKMVKGREPSVEFVAHIPPKQPEVTTVITTEPSSYVKVKGPVKGSTYTVEDDDHGVDMSKLDDNQKFMLMISNNLTKSSSVRHKIIECTGKDAQLVDDWVSDVKRCQNANKWKDNECILAMYNSTRDKMRHEWNRLDKGSPFSSKPIKYLDYMQKRFGLTEDQSKLAINPLSHTRFDDGDDFEEFFDKFLTNIDMAEVCPTEKSKILWLTSNIDHDTLAEAVMGREFETLNHVRSFCSEHLALKKRQKEKKNKAEKANKPQAGVLFKSKSDDESDNDQNSAKNRSRDRSNSRDRKQVRYNDDSKPGSRSQSPGTRYELKDWEVDGIRCCTKCCDPTHFARDCPIPKSSIPTPPKPTDEMLEKARKIIKEKGLKPKN